MFGKKIRNAKNRGKIGPISNIRSIGKPHKLPLN
jgi:hypothetical protein